MIRKERGGKKKRLLIYIYSFFILGIIIIISGIVYGYYHHSYDNNNTQQFSSYFTRIKTFLADRKQHISQHLHQINNEEKPEENIQFEFYTALPAMQIAAAPIPQSSTIKPNIVSAEELEHELARHIEKAKRENSK